MAKKVVGYIKLQVPAGQANPSPPIGPALGQRGLNIMEFFTFEMKAPPASFFLKKAAKITAGSKEPGKAVAGKVTMDQCREIAGQKIQGMNARDIEAAAKEIAGSARSMGLEVTGA